MIRLRCWARRASDGAFCSEPAGHDLNHYALVGDKHARWSGCAPDAGPDGRETAALRLLEVAHTIDRMALEDGEEGAAPGYRAVAARLYLSADDAAEDHALLRRVVAVGEESAQESASECTATEGRRIAEINALLALAADILRPFAEGKR